MLMRPARAGPVAATVVRGAHPLLCTSPWSRHHSVRWAAVRGGRKRSATPAAASLGAGSSGSDASSTLGVVIVDHGSRREASNDLLLEFVEIYREQTGRSIVEAAHMELAEPSIQVAFDRCVARGATTVVVSPYFLSPGRHWAQDIPALTQAAAAKHPGVQYLVSAPIGLHRLVAQVLDERLQTCLEHAAGTRDACDICAGTDRCQLRGGGIVGAEGV